MKFAPYDYPRRAIGWILDKPRCALFMGMGLGTGVITLTAIQRLIDDCEISPALVVAPKKVAESTWTAEAEKWDHLSGLKVARVMGTEKQRRVALESKADVYVIGRDSFVWLVGLYGGHLPFDAMVIDELTSFKSPKSNRFKAMRMSAAGVRRIVGLTGTPAPNGLIDLWAQMYCIDQGERLGKSVTRYREAYFETHKWNNIIVRCSAKPGCDKAIRDRLADICLTMQTRDYLSLPAMMTHDDIVELPPAVRRAYDRFERDKVLEFAEQNKEGGSPAVMASNAAALMGKLAQFANGAVYDEDGNAHEVHTEKLDRLAEIVEAAAGAHVLVFYQYRHDMARIRARLEKARKGIRVREYKGDGDLRDWNAGGIDVLMAHPASTAFGLNMQQGGHIIVWFGTGWNLELYQQANARLHRQGQSEPVQVYRLLCRGTVDERSSAALEGKKGVQQALLDSLDKLIKKHVKSNKNGKEKS